MKIAIFALIALACVAGALSVPAGRFELFNRQSHPSDWTVIGHATGSESVDFIVALKQRNLDVLDAKFWAISTPGSPEYRNFLTTEEINDIVRPEQKDFDRVIAWLKDAGVESMKDHGDSIVCRSSAMVAAELFSTEFHVFVNKQGQNITRAYGSMSIPMELQGIVEMVEGISLFPIPHQGSIQAPAAAAQGLVPESVQANYGTPSSSVGGSGTQGVIEFEGQNFSPSQLQTFANGIGISISPLSSDHIQGNNDPNAPGTESTLDIQWIAGVGIGNDNWFWLFGTGKWIYGMANALANANSFPDVISISYGWSEAAQCQDGIGGAECQQLGVDSKQYVQRANTEIQKLGAKGISVFAASGDSGAPGRTDGFCQDTHVNPTYPGASPYLTAVGATQLQGSTTPLSNPPSICSGQNCVSGGQEQAVSYDHAHFASGGGFSNVATQPDYQKSAVQAYLASSAKKPPSSYFTATGRAYPDVASFGSDILISQGGTEKVGGTSAASPIFAAVWATLNQEAIKKDGKPLGFANPLLYKAPSDCFNDITVGNNAFTEDGNPFGSCKGFYCATGWDPVTGLGSPKYACMLNYVKSVLN